MKKITIRKCTLKDADCILKVFNESVSKGLTETKKNSIRRAYKMA